MITHENCHVSRRTSVDIAEEKNGGKTRKKKYMIIVVVKNFKNGTVSATIVFVVGLFELSIENSQLNLHQIPHFFNCGESPMTIL